MTTVEQTTGTLPGRDSAHPGNPGQQFAEKIERVISAAKQYDERYGVYLCRTDASARAAAAALDAAVARGSDPGPLAGMVIAVKDLIATEDAPTTAQSLVHEDPWFDGIDAPIIARLREAGAVISGKTSMAEHAAARIDPALPFPVPRNPWDTDRWPGGSSSGSAIAVAIGLADAAIGTDTTGSLRIPAAFCGITGFRPTTGLVDTAGCMPASPTLDAIGPMARNARDCAAVLAVLAPTFAGADGENVESGWRDRLDGVRIGVPRTRIDAWGSGIDPEIREAFDLALGDLEGLGAELVDVALPEWDALSEATMMIAAKEMFDRHARWLRTRYSEYGRPFRRIAVLGGMIPAERIAKARAELSEARESLSTARLRGHRRHRDTDLGSASTVLPRRDRYVRRRP